MSFKKEENLEKTSQVVAKKEEALSDKNEELTFSGRYFVPDTDIFETREDLQVIMDIPGVEKDHLDIDLKENVLTVHGKVFPEAVEGMEAVYSEYNIGNFHRQFRIPGQIERDSIAANLENGVLRVTLPKAKSALPRKITVA